LSCFWHPFNVFFKNFNSWKWYIDHPIRNHQSSFYSALASRKQSFAHQNWRELHG
jgi:hypothetical protein